MFFRTLCLLGLVAANPLQAFAWGNEGHRMTGLVAQMYLTKAAKAELKRLMGQVPLSKIALYMDENKPALSKTKPGSKDWHYDDRPTCDNSVPLKDYCPDGNCASVQIKRHFGILLDDQASDDAKRFAIYALVHIVGDIHQPLHASDNDDAGGNGVKVKFTIDGSTKTAKLHSAWDTAFVRAAMPSTDERAVVGSWVQAYSGNIDGWRTGNVRSWMKESYDLSSALTYGKLPNFSCGIGDDSNTLTLSPEYVDQAKGVIPEQIVKAGVRTAVLLNRALGSN